MFLMSLDAYFTGKDCGFPGRPGNGSTIGAEKFFYPGEEVTFQCDNGYILFGADRRICQEDGSWSGALPECSKILTITRHNNTHMPYGCQYGFCCKYSVSGCILIICGDSDNT